MARRPPPAPPPRLERTLFLSPAGVRNVRLKLAQHDRDRLDGYLADGRVRVITTA